MTYILSVSELQIVISPRWSTQERAVKMRLMVDGQCTRHKMQYQAPSKYSMRNRSERTSRQRQAIRGCSEEVCRSSRRAAGSTAVLFVKAKQLMQGHGVTASRVHENAGEKRK